MDARPARAERRNWTADNPPPLVRPGERSLFTPVRDWLARRTDISWPAKFLYCRLERYAGRKISARPTQQLLATEMGVPLRTLQRYVAELRVERDGMPLIWVQQQGDGGPAKYYFPAHPWRAETVVDNSGRGISAPPKMTGLNGSAPPEMAGLKPGAYKGRARAVGDNYKRRQPAARGGAPSGRGPLFTQRGNPTGQARVAGLLAKITGGK